MWRESRIVSRAVKTGNIRENQDRGSLVCLLLVKSPRDYKTRHKARKASLEYL